MITVFTLISIAALSIILHLLWAWWRIRSHPHVEPAFIAIPEIEPYLSKIISDISQLAEISPPQLFVCRARLPNAFVIATIMRAELFITDELLEEINERQDKINYLINIFCHEIAHIKNHDSIMLGLLAYIKNLSLLLHFKFLEQKCLHSIADIEQQADLTANNLFQKYTLSLSEKT